jgi:hypothetical protein
MSDIAGQVGFRFALDYGWVAHADSTFDRTLWYERYMGLPDDLLGRIDIAAMRGDLICDTHSRA